LGKAGPRAVGIVAVALVVAGFIFPVNRYLSPEHGLGYLLGWIGASMMLLLFLYSIKKRWPNHLPRSHHSWFWWHPLLGVFGPIAILYHTAFRLGKANGWIALVSMLIVATSGVVGRYLYNRVRIPPFDTWFRWWRLIHLPFLGMLAMTALAHIISTFVY